jgi:CRISPR/Cas system CMR-associated protein Cmr5 small subunit
MRWASEDWNSEIHAINSVNDLDDSNELFMSDHGRDYVRVMTTMTINNKPMLPKYFYRSAYSALDNDKQKVGQK